jgi:hypothetical protein
MNLRQYTDENMWTFWSDDSLKITYGMFVHCPSVFITRACLLCIRMTFCGFSPQGTRVLLDPFVDITYDMLSTPLLTPLSVKYFGLDLNRSVAGSYNRQSSRRKPFDAPVFGLASRVAALDCS